MTACEWDRRGLRLKIRDILWRFKPRAEAAEIAPVVNEVMAALGRRPLALLVDEPAPGCACWLCVLRLEGWVTQSHATMRTARESAEEFD